jgi:hypothetical protein
MTRMMAAQTYNPQMYGSLWLLLDDQACFALIGGLIRPTHGLAFCQRVRHAGLYILANILGLDITLLVFNGRFSSLLTANVMSAITEGVPCGCYWSSLHKPGMVWVL